jgi:4-oxalomesaconate tautomerase
MVQKMIPCLLMRGGTSRGTYFYKEHLPRDRATLDEVLLEVMGSPDPHQIDGLGGATATTSKVAVLSRSQEPGIDIDFLFAQVSVTTAVVDWGRTCGNILAGVGPAAVEMGLVPDIGDAETKVRIRLVNTGGFVEAVVQTPGGAVTYEGDAAIDGVPGTAAPVELNFVDVVGSKTGKLLPTGRLRNLINGIEVTCLDCAVPTVVARASALGKTGYESKLELDLDTGFFRRIEAIRRRAGEMMGLGDVAGRVIPKFAMVAEPRGRGSLTARYFVPTTTHPSMAVTGAIAISCCSILDGTVAHEVSAHTQAVREHTHHVLVEHPSGEIPIVLKARQQPDSADAPLDVYSAGAIRTARLLFTGMVLVPCKAGREMFPLAEEFHEMSHQFSQLYRPRKKLPLTLRGKSLRPSGRAHGSSLTFASPRAREMPGILVQGVAVPAVLCAPPVGVGSICRSPSGFL